MAHESLTRGRVLLLLKENPARIARLTAGLTPTELRQPPAPNAWSANDVLAHLRCCSDVWGGYIRRLIDEEAPGVRG